MKAGFVFFLILGLLQTGCMGSKYYKPASKFEQEALLASNKNIYPLDIKKNPTAFLNQKIAWTGVVKSIKPLKESIQQIQVYEIDIKHHYWDWILDFGMQPERILLSPKGEGNFKVRRALKRPPKPEDFVIVYGKPKLNNLKELLVSEASVSIFPRKAYTTKAMTYTRPGSPIEVNEPIPFKVTPPSSKK